MIVYPPITPTTSRKVSMSVNNNSGSSTATNKSNNSNSSVSNNNNSNSNNSSGRRQTQVQWRLTNVQQGVVKVDSAQLYSLLKTEPIEKYYQLDEEPFARGAFASVRRVRSRETGQIYAAKFSSRSRYGEDSTAEIYHEIALLSLCSPSPRIIKLHDVFQTTDEIIIVMEFAPGGDMQTIIDDNVVPFEADVVRFVQHVVEGLAYLHHRKIAHLDIKPQNLVMMGDFPDCAVKVCDFEISRVILDGTQIRELLGTPEYVAPEILHYEPITLAVDMWSLGVTVYVLLTGFSPFGGETDQETFLNISQARLDFPEELFEDVSENAIDFIKKLLIRNPSERMTAKECLKHPWLATNKKKANAKKSAAPIEVNRGRVGCSSCSATNHNHQNLRKYLSKSREALFERVISKHKQHSLEQQTGQNLRKSTLLSQYNKTKRMCESQMSLVSKSRERLLQGSMSPSITRSREKLYGIKSLSKSHEVLNLCKTVSALALSSDDKKPLEGLLKTLTRAATATGDLTTNTNLECSQIITNVCKETNGKISEETETKVLKNDSNISNNDSLIEQDNNTIEKEENTEKRETVIASLPVPLLTDYQPLQTVLTLLRCNKTNGNNNSNSNNNITTSDIMVKVEDNKGNLMTCENEKIETVVPQENLEMESCDENKCNSNIPTISDESKLSIQRPKLCLMKQLSVISSEGDDLNSPAISQSDSLSLTEGNSSSDSDLSEEDNNGSLERITGDISSCDDDEPRFSVKQLISAYNLHQEIVTKTSLEVTMSTPNTEEKILPVIDKVPNKKFPTGPNALRLFIPDLHITKSKRTSRRKHSIRKEGDNNKEQSSQLREETRDETGNIKAEEAKFSSKENEPIETKVKDIEEKNTNRIGDNSLKKNSLTVDNITAVYNRSSSLSSETSCDKTSGISSTLTSYEDIIINSGDNQKKKSRSNRSSGVISIDNENVAEELINSNETSKKTSRSNRSSGVISSDGENIPESSILNAIQRKISQSNRSSSALSSDGENIAEYSTISNDVTKKIYRNKASGVVTNDSESNSENINSSNEKQQRQRKISRSKRSSGILSSDLEITDNSSNNHQPQPQRKISRSNRSSVALSSDGEHNTENTPSDNTPRQRKISRNNKALSDSDNISEALKSSSDNPRKITRINRSSSDIVIIADDTNSSSDLLRKPRSNRTSRVESLDGENIAGDFNAPNDNQRRISRSNRSSGVGSSDGENMTDELISSCDPPRKPRSNRSSRVELYDVDHISTEIVSSDNQLKKSRSNKCSAISISNESDHVTDILNKTTITSSSYKSTEKTLSAGTPRLNRKSFPCSRSPNVSPALTEKTRRKSNPAMKPPFY